MYDIFCMLDCSFEVGNILMMGEREREREAKCMYAVQNPRGGEGALFSIRCIASRIMAS